MTNALPIRRMGLPVAATAAAPAAYVRAVGLAVERLGQTYARTADQAGGQRYDYTAPAFDYGGPSGLRPGGPGARLPTDRRPARLTVLPAARNVASPGSRRWYMRSTRAAGAARDSLALCPLARL